MKRIFLLGIILISEIDQLFAGPISTGIQPDNALFRNGGNGLWLVELLSIVEEILLKVALPLTIIGTTLYVAYHLFTADGNEEQLKKTWKTVTFGAIWALCIALGYAIISLVSRLSL